MSRPITGEVERVVCGTRPLLFVVTLSKRRLRIPLRTDEEARAYADLIGRRVRVTIELVDSQLTPTPRG